MDNGKMLGARTLRTWKLGWRLGVRKPEFWSYLLVFGSMIVASRAPLAPRHLFSFDSVNFAYALRDFDPRASRPQPPGYPLFVFQMRLLEQAGIRQPERILLTLALAGSAAAVIALAWYGNRMLGGDAGACGAWLLLFHPAFWIAGLTSPVRVQLAVFSVMIAGACFRAWSGERRWVYWSALWLGIGAGVRPELGACLFPLWAWSARKSAGDWRLWWSGLGVLAAAVAAWMTPTAWAAGGPVSYFQTCWSYLADQSGLTSALFGAAPEQQKEALVRLLVWTGPVAAACFLAPVAAQTREGRFGPGRASAAFLFLWIAPPLVFAGLVHVAAPGQTLALVPAACLIAGYGLSRAACRLRAFLGREHALIALLLPVLFAQGFIFFGRLEAPKADAGTGWGRLWTQVWEALDRTSLWYVRRISRADAEAWTALRRLAAERPWNTVVVWHEAPVSWRKAAYYFPELPIVVLGRKGLDPTDPPVAQRFLGPRLEKLVEGSEPVTVSLTASGRVIWMVEPGGEFLAQIEKSFALRRAAGLAYSDLPADAGARQIGDYLFEWQPQ